ncbi:MAG: diguanylate cyclase, partial [Acholeplasmataceae bacterium]|nr:diguanylate cyclase [Acholeplasmataceae bacterium]
FLIIVKEATEQKLSEMMKELDQLTENKDLVEHISFSYGATSKKHISESLTILMRRADLNLYEMKEKHKEIKEKIANELARKLELKK